MKGERNRPRLEGGKEGRQEGRQEGQRDEEIE